MHEFRLHTVQHIGSLLQQQKPLKMRLKFTVRSEEHVALHFLFGWGI